MEFLINLIVGIFSLAGVLGLTGVAIFISGRVFQGVYWLATSEHRESRRRYLASIKKYPRKRIIGDN